MGMNVLVVGGTGFLGRRVVALLQQRGHTTIVYHRGYRAVPTRADVIVNCAGILREWGQTFQEVHVDLTSWLLRLAKKLSLERFVMVSAIGARPDGTAYQRSKWQAEQLVLESGIEFVIVRPSLIFGPGDRSVNLFRAFSRTGFCPLLSEVAVQPVHVDTVARVIVAAVEGEIENRTVEVGGPEVFTYRELLDRIHRGVRAVRLPEPLVRLLVKFSRLHHAIPTAEMIMMLREDNVTTDRTVAELGIQNPKLR